MDYFACARAFLSGGLARRFALFSDAQKGVRRVLDRACVRRVEEGVFLIEKQKIAQKNAAKMSKIKKIDKKRKKFFKRVFTKPILCGKLWEKVVLL